MNERVDLLIQEIDHFVNTADVGEYVKQKKMKILLEEDSLVIHYQGRVYHFCLVENEKDQKVYWKSLEEKKIAYSKQKGIEYLLQEILKGSL